MDIDAFLLGISIGLSIMFIVLKRTMREYNKIIEHYKKDNDHLVRKYYELVNRMGE